MPPRKHRTEQSKQSMKTPPSPSESTFRPTARDIHIIEAVYTYRALTASQISALFFPKTTIKEKPKTHSNCERRLRLLTQHGYLLKKEQAHLLSEGKKELVYHLAKKGAEEIATLYGVPVAKLDWRPGQENISNLFRDHLLATNAVRIAIVKAAATHGYELVEWRDDKTLKREHANIKVPITGKTGQPE